MLVFLFDFCLFIFSFFYQHIHLEEETQGVKALERSSFGTDTLDTIAVIEIDFIVWDSAPKGRALRVGKGRYLLAAFQSELSRVHTNYFRLKGVLVLIVWAWGADVRRYPFLCAVQGEVLQYRGELKLATCNLPMPLLRLSSSLMFLLSQTRAVKRKETTDVLQ